MSKHTAEKPHINLTIQGIKGGKTKIQKAGYVLIELRHHQDMITVDDFEGTGNSYKQRELQNIQIIQNCEILFEGTKYELFEILTHHKKAAVKH